MLHITVLVKNVWGVQTVYPACEKSEKFAQLAGTKTLTTHALRTIESLGYTIFKTEQVTPIPGLKSPAFSLHGSIHRN